MDEPTLFAFSLWRHVDLYTSRVSNIVNFGVTHRFYPTKVRASFIFPLLSLSPRPARSHGLIVFL